METVTTRFAWTLSKFSASLYKFDMRVDRPSFGNHGSVSSNSAISKLFTRWICHSQNFQDFITVLYQPSPSAGKLWWNDTFSFVDVIFFTTLDTVINLPSDRLERPRGRTVGENCLKRGNRILSTLKYNAMIFLFTFLQTICCTFTIRKVFLSNCTTNDRAAIHERSSVIIFLIISWNNPEQLPLWREYNK